MRCGGGTRVDRGDRGARSSGGFLLRPPRWYALDAAFSRSAQRIHLPGANPPLELDVVIDVGRGLVPVLEDVEAVEALALSQGEQSEALHVRDDLREQPVAELGGDPGALGVLDTCIGLEPDPLPDLAALDPIAHLHA